ncbi:MAG: FAD binding domain-containing protein [Deltaproteobacteria bacterium]|nr:FAD binding domain-containing protein [Deltaproteobacteria bacterium]
MKYYRPSSISEALSLMGENTKVIAGGTDLVVRIEKGLFKPHDIIDITYLPLKDIVFSSGSLKIGALSTMASIIADSTVWDHAPLLAKAAMQLGAPPIRNRATIGGNIVNASPAADSVSALMALDASVTLVSTRGERTLPLEKFFMGPGKTVMEKDEILTTVIIDTAKPENVSKELVHFHKMGPRKAQVISISALSARTFLDSENTVISSKIALASVAPVPFRAYVTEDFLKGKKLTTDVVEEAVKVLRNEIKPIDDVRGSAKYRLHVSGSFLKHHLIDTPEGRAEKRIPKGIVTAKPITGNTPEGEIHVTVNGKSYSFSGDLNMRLLDYLRDELGLTGTKNGCGEGECGACTILLDGVAVNSCMILTGGVDGREITTIEGLKENGKPGLVQQAFVDAGAVQCGFCIPGFEISAHSLVVNEDEINREDIREALSGNLCRCTGYEKIFEAVELASHRRKTND